MTEIMVTARIHLQLRNQGYIVNHKKVQRIMRKLGIKGKKVWGEKRASIVLIKVLLERFQKTELIDAFTLVYLTKN